MTRDYLDSRDLALRVMGDKGFAGLKKELGGRLTPSLAFKIVEVMRGYGVEDIDPGLMALASEKRRGPSRPSGPPAPGERRAYTVNAQGRVVLPVSVLGKGPGDRVGVVYRRDRVVVTGDGGGNEN